jgi:hypothetical protein
LSYFQSLIMLNLSRAPRRHQGFHDIDIKNVV